MVFGIGNKCAKYLVFFFNFLIFVLGITILAVSLSVLFSNDVRKYFQNILDQAQAGVSLSELFIPLYVLAAVGGLLLLTGFLGCCGACTENICLLSIFFAIVLILFIAELACGIAILVAKDKFKDEAFKVITEQIQKYDSDPKLRGAIDEMQTQLQCCGCHGPLDYGTRAPPASCSKGLVPFTRGCCDVVWGDLESKAAIVGGVAIGVLVIEFLAMVFSCILCQAFRRGDYQYA